MTTELERIAKLEVRTDVVEDTLDKHSEQIETLNKMSMVVDKLNENVIKQGDNIDKLANALSVVTETTRKIQEAPKNIWWDFSVNTFKSGFFKVLPWLIIVGGSLFIKFADKI